VVVVAGEVGDEGLDHEGASPVQMGGDVPQAADLLGLGGQGEEGVERYVHQAVRTVHGDIGEVTYNTGMSPPSGFWRSLATIASEESMPSTLTPRRVSGRATGPVPTPSSSARPSPASPARNSTAADGSIGPGNQLS
jgi:hypothetical protein